MEVLYKKDLMKYAWLISVVVLCIVLGCKKYGDSPYTFTGKVTDSRGNPVSGVTVELLAYYRGSFFGGGGFETEAKAKTDGTGGFKTRFNYKSIADHFAVQISTSDYYFYFNENIFIDDIHDFVLTRNPIINRLARIKINFKNTAPFSVADEFSVNYSNQLGGAHSTLLERKFTGGQFNELEHKYTGNSVEGYELSKAKGDAFSVIYWSTKKNGIVTLKTDSLFIEGGRQGEFTINY